jgi:hypothetical protein
MLMKLRVQTLSREDAAAIRAYLIQRADEDKTLASPTSSADTAQ